jgi:hypothetical protein
MLTIRVQKDLFISILSWLKTLPQEGNLREDEAARYYSIKRTLRGITHKPDRFHRPVRSSLPCSASGLDSTFCACLNVMPVGGICTHSPASRSLTVKIWRRG